MMNADSDDVAVEWTEPTASDNSGSHNLTSDFNPGDAFSVGTTNVTYKVTDDAGNSATCFFSVYVLGMQQRRLCILCIYWQSLTFHLSPISSEMIR